MADSATGRSDTVDLGTADTDRSDTADMARSGTAASADSDMAGSAGWGMVGSDMAVLDTDWAIRSAGDWVPGDLDRCSMAADTSAITTPITAGGAAGRSAVTIT